MSILESDIDIKPVLVSDILTLHWWSVPYGDYEDAIKVVTNHLMKLYKAFYECDQVVYQTKYIGPHRCDITISQPQSQDNEWIITTLNVHI
jgi:hypothetical protein